MKSWGGFVKNKVMEHYGQNWLKEAEKLGYWDKTRGSWLTGSRSDQPESGFKASERLDVSHQSTLLSPGTLNSIHALTDHAICASRRRG